MRVHNGLRQALTRQLQHSEPRYLRGANPRAVLAQQRAEMLLHLGAVFFVLHVNEVNHNQPAQVAQAQLTGDDFGGGEVGAQGGFLYVFAAAHLGGVDINGHQRLGGVKDHAGARRRGDFAGEDFLNLPFQRVVYDFALVQPRASGLVGENQRHEGGDFLVVRRIVAHHFRHIGTMVVADGAQQDVVFAVDEDGTLLFFAGFGEGFPEFEQVVQIPAQFLGGAPESGGAENDGHSARRAEFAQALHHFVAGAAVALLGDLAPAGLQRHQNQIASRQRDVHGERGALFGDMVASDLHQHAVALLDGGRGGDGGEFGGVGFFAVVAAVLVEDARDVLEGEESVFVVAEVDEGGLKGGLNAGDDALVDVALAVFASGDFVVEVGEASVFGDDDPAFFGMLGADENSFHVAPSWPDCLWLRSGGCGSVVCFSRLADGAELSPRIRIFSLVPPDFSNPCQPNSARRAREKRVVYTKLGESGKSRGIFFAGEIWLRTGIIVEFGFSPRFSRKEFFRHARSVRFRPTPMRGAHSHPRRGVCAHGAAPSGAAKWP